MFVKEGCCFHLASFTLEQHNLRIMFQSADCTVNLGHVTPTCNKVGTFVMGQSTFIVHVFITACLAPFLYKGHCMI